MMMNLSVEPFLDECLFSALLFHETLTMRVTMIPSKLDAFLLQALNVMAFCFNLSFKTVIFHYNLSLRCLRSLLLMARECDFPAVFSLCVSSSPPFSSSRLLHHHLREPSLRQLPFNHVLPSFLHLWSAIHFDFANERRRRSDGGSFHTRSSMNSLLSRFIDEGNGYGASIFMSKPTIEQRWIIRLESYFARDMVANFSA